LETPFLDFTSNVIIFPIAFTIVYLLALGLTKVPLEQHLLKDTQKIFMHIGRVAFLTIFSTALLLGILGNFYNYSFNFNDGKTITIILLYALIAFMIAFFLYMIYLIITVGVRRRFYFIFANDDNNKEIASKKYYIIKKMDNERILLSNHKHPNNESIHVIQNQDYLIDKVVYTDTEKLSKRAKSLLTFGKKD
jgi:hypothetical protein